MDDLQLKLILEAKDRLTSVLKSATKAADKNLTSVENKLTQVSKKLDDFGNKFTMVGAGITAAGYGMARAFDLTNSLKEVTNFEHELRALGNTGGLTSSQLDNVSQQIRKIGAETNNYNNDVIEGINTLVAAGMNPEIAIKYMTAIGKTATSQQANINDIAKTTFSLADNMKVPLQEINYALNVLTAAGKEGRFELKSMAQTFPELTASASMLGMKGTKSVASLGAALQIAMKGAGTEGEAATNFSRFLGGLTSPLVVKNFSEKFGISMEQVINNAAKKGADPILEVLKIIQQKTGGNMFKVSEVFHDKTMLDFIKPMLKNMDEYNRIKSTILRSNNVIEEDYAKIMSTTSSQWKQLTINLQKIAFDKLEKPLVSINKVLTTINQNPAIQKGLFNTIIGTFALGTITTGIGLFNKFSSVIVSGYIQIANSASKLPSIYSVLNKIGLTTTSHTAKYVANIAQNGNKLGINLTQQMMLGMSADAARMRKQIWNSIITPIKLIPANAKNTGNMLRSFIFNFPTNSANSYKVALNAIKMGFVNFIPNCRKALVAIRLFSSAFLFNPVGLAIMGIATGAFLIYKYWKPITAFFKGTFRGIKDGLAPLQPTFTAIGNAIKPIVDWVKRLFTPINTDGKKAESWGYAFGKGIAWTITKIVEAVKWVKNLITLGGRLGGSKDKSLQKTKEHGSHANGLKRVPFDGYRAKLHQDEAVLTAKEANIWRNRNKNNENITVNYNPTINLVGATETTKTEFLKELQKHKNEIVKMIEDVQRRKIRGAYA